MAKGKTRQDPVVAELAVLDKAGASPNAPVPIQSASEPVTLPAAVESGAGAVAPASAISPEQQAAVDKVFEEARRAAEAILGGSPSAKLGTPSNGEAEKQEYVQRDHIPGTMRRDRTAVPEFVYDESEGVTRRALLHSDYRYALAPQDDFLNYTMRGYKFVKYDGGNQSGLAPRGFLGTGDAIFTRELNGNCRRGDCFYMWIPIRGWQALDEEDKAKIADQTNRAVGSFYNAGYREGIRAWVDVNGVRLT